jgi:hypothetical protein
VCCLLSAFLPTLSLLPGIGSTGSIGSHAPATFSPVAQCMIAGNTNPANANPANASPANAN